MDSDADNLTNGPPAWAENLATVLILLTGVVILFAIGILGALIGAAFTTVVMWLHLPATQPVIWLGQLTGMVCAIWLGYAVITRATSGFWPWERA